MADAINEGSLSVTSMVRIRDVLNPTDVNIYRQLAGGVTTINVLHGSANTIGGQNAVVKLKYGTRRRRDAVPGRDAGHQVRARRERDAEELAAGGAGAAGARCAIRRRAWARKKCCATRSRARATTRRRGTTTTPRSRRATRTSCRRARNLELDPLVEVLEGKRLVHAHSYRADEMLMLLNVAKEFGFTVKTLQHGLEGYKIASEIAQAGTGLSTLRRRVVVQDRSVRRDSVQRGDPDAATASSRR